VSKHIDRVRRAIEFECPDVIPMDLVDVPYLYDAYGTLDPETVKLPRGAEGFDSAWCTYHWRLEDRGANQQGHTIRIDEWGCTQAVPRDPTTGYTIVERPDLSTVAKVRGHPWPHPADSEPFFRKRQAVIHRHYPDRFINGFLDPGPCLIAFELLGYEELLVKTLQDPALLREVLARILSYQQGLVPHFKQMGAHMITIIDEIAGTGGLMISPDVFRSELLPLYRQLLQTVHQHGMYTSLLLDGDIGAILPDLLDLPVDVHLFVQPRATGLEAIHESFHGRRAVKLSVDMMDTLVKGTAGEIEAEVARYVELFHTSRGGLIFQALRWHRPEYDPARVQAQLEAMNRYRKGA